MSGADILNRLDNKLSGKTEKDPWLKNMVVVMERFGYTPAELMEINLPQFMSICEVLADEAKKEESKLGGKKGAGSPFM